MPTKTAPVGALSKPTAAQIRRGLRKFFPHGRCGIVFECAQGTGWAANRHIDALAMDLWPSHGLLLHGIEIKVTRSDWRRELADPAKAEQLARFCDKFWVAAPPDVVPVDELPHAWGLLEGGVEGMRIKKQAVKTPAEKVTKALLAAVFRASGRSIAADESALALETAMQSLRDKHAEAVKVEAERLSTNNSDDAKHWRALAEALGIPVDGIAHIWSHDAKRWIAVIRAVHQSGVMESYNGLAGLHQALAGAMERVKAGMDALAVPVTDDAAAALGRIQRRGKA